MSEEHNAEHERLAAIAFAESRRESMSAGQPTEPGMRGIPQAVSVVWPKERPEYVVRVWLWDNGARFESSGFDVTRLAAGKPISSTTLRELPVRELIDEATERFLAQRIELAERALAEEVRGQSLLTYDAATGETQNAEVDDEFIAAKRAYWQEARDAARQRLERVQGQGKRPRYGAGHLEEVARIVREAERDGRPRQTAVAEAFGLSRSAAGNHIAAARAKRLFADQPQTQEGE